MATHTMFRPTKFALRSLVDTVGCGKKRVTVVHLIGEIDANGTILVDGVSYPALSAAGRAVAGTGAE